MGIEAAEPNGWMDANNSAFLAPVTVSSGDIGVGEIPSPSPLGEIVAEPLNEAYGQGGGEEVNCCARLTPVWAAGVAALLAVYLLVAFLLLPLSFVVLISLLALLPFMAFLGVGWAASNRDKVSANRILLAMVAGAVMFVVALFAEAIVLVPVILVVAVLSGGLDLASWQCYVVYAAEAAAAASVEEVAKLCAVALATIPVAKRMNPLGLTIMSMTGALTLATIENLEYMFGIARGYPTLLEALMAVGMRDVISVPFHACTGIIIGASLAKMFVEARRREANGEEGSNAALYLTGVAKSLVVPVIMHFLFDAILMETSCVISMTGSLGLLFIDLGSIVVFACTAGIALVMWKQLVPISSVNVHTGRVEAEQVVSFEEPVADLTQVDPQYAQATVV